MTTLVLQVVVCCHFFFLKPIEYFRNLLTQAPRVTGLVITYKL